MNSIGLEVKNEVQEMDTINEVKNISEHTFRVGFMYAINQLRKLGCNATAQHLVTKYDDVKEMSFNDIAKIDLK